MTPQEAINFFKNEIHIDLRVCDDKKFEDTKTVLKMAIKALEKQIPKKVLILGKQYVGVARAGICKNCGMTENNSGNYCRYCGQALDWEDM